MADADARTKIVALILVLIVIVLAFILIFKPDLLSWIKEWPEYKYKAGDDIDMAKLQDYLKTQEDCIIVAAIGREQLGSGPDKDVRRLYLIENKNLVASGFRARIESDDAPPKIELPEEWALIRSIPFIDIKNPIVAQVENNILKINQAYLTSLKTSYVIVLKKLKDAKYRKADMVFCKTQEEYLKTIKEIEQSGDYTKYLIEECAKCNKFGTLSNLFSPCTKDKCHAISLPSNEKCVYSGENCISCKSADCNSFDAEDCLEKANWCGLKCEVENLQNLVGRKRCVEEKPLQIEAPRILSFYFTNNIASPFSGKLENNIAATTDRLGIYVSHNCEKIILYEFESNKRGFKVDEAIASILEVRYLKKGAYTFEIVCVFASQEKDTKQISITIE